jgi:DNA-binding response OmpR family regulator
MRLLIVEDAPRLRATIAKALDRLGHAVDVAADGPEGAEMARRNRYDVVVLDRMLPGKDGLAVLAEMRARRDETPVLILTALDSVGRRVEGLSQGADDYLTKPFALEELVARIEALARRRYGLADPVLECGSLRIDLGAKSVAVDGAPVELKPREFALLACLALRPGRVMSRVQIEEQLYGDAGTPASNSVDSAVCSLRRSLGDAGARIKTRRGLGYVLEAASSP